MIVNILVTAFFGYLLVTSDYTIRPKWMYYMDGTVFAVNFAIVAKYLTETFGY
jgi:uncharacterized membrane protein